MSQGWQGESGEVGQLERLERADLLVLGGRCSEWCLDEGVRALSCEPIGPKRSRQGESTKGPRWFDTRSSIHATCPDGARSNGAVDANGQPGLGRRRSVQLRRLESCGSADVCPHEIRIAISPTLSADRPWTIGRAKQTDKVAPPAAVRRSVGPPVEGSNRERGSRSPHIPEQSVVAVNFDVGGNP